MSQGRYITVEGVDGCGKSQQIFAIRDYLQRHGINVIHVREPGGTVISEKCRSLLLDINQTGMMHNTELLLMAAARAQLFGEVIKPALERNVWVTSDRGVDSGFAYQHYGRGMSQTAVEQLEHIAMPNYRPDLTFYLDVSVEKTLQRRQKREHETNTAPDRFEVEQIEFFHRVRQGFLARSKAESNRIAVINADDDIDMVTTQIKTELDRLMAWPPNRAFDRNSV